jgi:hypothetical protein
MTDTKQKESLQTILFANLVLMLGSTAMQQLGKIVSPMTNKSETDLQGARTTIDMIEMIQARTEGNRTDDEEKLLSDTLSSLQINYVETAQKEPEKKDESGDEKKDEPKKEDESSDEQKDEPKKKDEPEKKATEEKKA